jgi:hypothetical protein
VTIVLPGYSRLSPTDKAAATLAPVEMPPGMPSTLATRCDTSNACSLDTVMISSIKLVSRIDGMKPAPIPSILWGPRGLPDRTGLVVGSTAMILRLGLHAHSDLRLARDF